VKHWQTTSSGKPARLANHQEWAKYNIKQGTYFVFVALFEVLFGLNHSLAERWRFPGKVGPRGIDLVQLGSIGIPTTNKQRYSKWPHTTAQQSNATQQMHKTSLPQQSNATQHHINGQTGHDRDGPVRMNCVPSLCEFLHQWGNFLDQLSDGHGILVEALVSLRLLPGLTNNNSKIWPHTPASNWQTTLPQLAKQCPREESSAGRVDVRVHDTNIVNDLSNFGHWIFIH